MSRTVFLVARNANKRACERNLRRVTTGITNLALLDRAVREGLGRLLEQHELGVLGEPHRHQVPELQNAQRLRAQRR